MTYCNSCGTLLPPGATHCPNCGAATPSYYSNTGTEANAPTVAQPPPPPTVYGSTPYAPPFTPSGQQNPYAPTTPSPPPYVTPQARPQPAYPPLTPDGPQGQKPPRRFPTGITVLLIVLAVLVILAGASLFFVIRSNQVATDNAHANATATAHANAQTATTQANLTATVVAQANATATFVANPYPPNSGTLALFDPLKDNSKGHRWDEGTFSGGGRCQFTGGTYHAAEGTKNSFYACFANNNTFGNVAYQAEVTILKGDCGGLIFRADSANLKFYFFEVCQDGTYDIALFSGNAGKYLVNHTTNATIKTGLNQTNVIAVVAKGSTIQLYVNNTSVDSVVDTSFSQGAIGVLADEYNNATEVAFANVKVWTL